MPDTPSTSDPLRSTAREARKLADDTKGRLTYWEPRLNEFGAADRLFEIASALANAVLSQADTIDELRAEVERLTTNVEVWRARAHVASTGPWGPL